MTPVAPPSLAERSYPLTIDGGADGSGRAVLRARGEIVHGCDAVLAAALAELPASTRRVELDMTGVIFMDTAGQHFLDTLRDHGQRHLIAVSATNWHGQPRRILELIGLDTSDPLRPVDPNPQGLRSRAPLSSSVSLERAEQLHELREEIEHLRRAIASRPVIDQARGILMATHSCTSDEAWHILREASQLSNTKLHTVAAAITSGAESEAPPPPGEVREALRRALARRGR
ncbi:ANTAR domain-containing response regulator [Streptomyces sp. NPDC089424]|uniref:ANTAR domain-containing response regulator n=1 Tax=Streptomyces sp. NPDC089424 TaxID=3365917 RepID=UPI0038261FBA